MVWDVECGSGTVTSSGMGQWHGPWTALSPANVYIALVKYVLAQWVSKAASEQLKQTYMWVYCYAWVRLQLTPRFAHCAPTNEQDCFGGRHQQQQNLCHVLLSKQSNLGWTAWGGLAVPLGWVCPDGMATHSLCVTLPFHTNPQCLKEPHIGGTWVKRWACYMKRQLRTGPYSNTCLVAYFVCLRNDADVSPLPICLFNNMCFPAESHRVRPCGHGSSAGLAAWSEAALSAIHG